MDNSELYIKQCEKAVEIQTRYSAYGGRLPIVYDTETTLFVEVWRLPGDTVWRKTWVWLPTQSQLQEMLHYDNPWSFIWALGRFTEVEASSMEQLTLQFVMSQNYGKTWDGEDWVKA